MTPEDYLLDRAERNGDCLEWQLALNNAGYGTASFEGRSCGAHVLAHEVWIGPIPEGYHVHHRCENKRCIEPTHLKAIPNDLNAALVYRMRRGQMPRKDLRVARYLHRLVGVRKG